MRHLSGRVVGGLFGLGRRRRFRFGCLCFGDHSGGLGDSSGNQFCFGIICVSRSSSEGSLFGLL
jgi:hypothetical protein